MRPRVWGWLPAATALPAMLVGHALAYFLAGYSQADGHHGYFFQTLAYSATFVGILVLALIARALIFVGSAAPRGSSLVAAWVQLTVMQISLFTVFERIEGYVPAIAAYVAQAVVALCVALALAYLTRLLERCRQNTAEASSYIRRLRCGPHGTYIGLSSHSLWHALSIRVGPSRFARPPPRP